MKLSVVIIASAAAAARADFFLARSWPQSDTCDVSTPSFSYVDNTLNFLQCQTAPNKQSTSYRCFNSTAIQVTAWMGPNCAGAIVSGYPLIFNYPSATGACQGRPGGGGGSSQASCISSQLPYSPPASEPYTASIFSLPYSYSPGTCAGMPVRVTSVSAGLAGKCTPILNTAVSFQTGPSTTWGSIAIEPSCTGTSASLTYAYYSANTACSGAPTIQANWTSSACQINNDGSYTQAFSPCEVSNLPRFARGLRARRARGTLQTF